MAKRSAPPVPGLRRSRWTRFRAAVRSRIAWAWRPQLYAGIILAFLLGRAVPSAQIAPFGIAFFLAVRAAGFRGAGALAIAFSVILGSATVVSASQLVTISFAVLLSQPLASLMRLGSKGASPMGAAVAAFIVACIPAITALDQSDIISLLFWCGVTGVLSMVFTLAVQDMVSGRPVLSGPAESPIPVVILVASAFCGLQGVPAWGPVSLHDVAASALIMLCAYFAGPAMGTVVAAVFAISFLFLAVADSAVSAELIQQRSMAYVLAGLFAGTFRDLRKLGVAVGFCLGLVTYSAVQGDLRDTTELRMLVSSALLGTAVFILLPARWVHLIPSLLERPKDPAEEESPVDSSAHSLTDRVKGVAKVLRDVSHTFEQVAAVSAPLEPVLGQAVQETTDRICQSCSMHRQCWETELNRTTEVFSDLWTQLEESGPLSTTPAPEVLEKHCIYAPQVASTLNYLHDLHRSRESWERRIADGRQLASEYMRNVARLLERLGEEATLPTGKARLQNAPVMRVASGVARLPKRGVHVSGDSYVAAQLSPDRFLLALSDGMGVGKGAASESRQCVALLEEILAAGLGTEVAVNTVNSVLLLRSTEEAFATVDLAQLDLSTGRAEFVKIGAAPSFVKRGDEVTVIKMASVPAGIMNQVQVEPEYRQLRPGDIVVMITDGIWDVAKDDVDKDRWLINQLRRERSTDPEEIAESLLANALEIMPEASDDMTVLVARIDSISSKPNQPVRAKATSGWVAARPAPRHRK